MITKQELTRRAKMKLPRYRDNAGLYQQIWRARKALGLLPDRAECQAALLRKR